jgi:hypothetical protein
MLTPESLFDLNSLFIDMYSFGSIQELLDAFAVGTYFKVEEVVITSDQFACYDARYQAIKFAGNIRVLEHRISGSESRLGNVDIECAIESYERVSYKTVQLTITSNHRIIDGKIIVRYFPVVRESISGNMIPDEPGVSFTYNRFKKGVFNFNRLKFERIEFSPQIHKIPKLSSIHLQEGDKVAITIRNRGDYHSAIEASCVESTDSYIKFKILVPNFLRIEEWMDDCYLTERDSVIEDLVSKGLIYPQLSHTFAYSKDEDVPVMEFFVLVEIRQMSNIYGQSFNYVGSRVVYEIKSGFFVSSKIDHIYCKSRSIKIAKAHNIDPYPFATPQPDGGLDYYLTGTVNVCKVI